MSTLTKAIKRDIDILDYAQKIGFTPVKMGNQYTLKEIDSMRIDTKNNVYYRHSDSTGDSIIDFVMNIENRTLDEAVKHLRGLLNDTPKRENKPLKFKEPPVKKNLELPFKTPKQYNNLYSYLNKSRGITVPVIKDMINKKQLYQDTRNHCIFVGYDKNNNPAYGFKRSTTSADYNYQFKGDCKGSNKEVGLLVKNGSTSLFVSEAVIDSMSLMTILHENQKDFKQYDYLALGGTSTLSLDYHLENNKYNKIYICTDNDSSGFEARENIKKLLTEKGFDGKIFDKIPKNKDFNDDLLESKNKAININQSLQNERAM